VLVLASSADGNDLVSFPGELISEPAYGLPAMWLPAAEFRVVAERSGHVVVDRTTMVITHLEVVMRNHAGQLLSRGDVKDLLEELQPHMPVVLEDLRDAKVTYATVQQVLAQLLTEGVPITNLAAIIEAITEAERIPGGVTAEQRVELVRRRIAAQMVARYVDTSGRLFVVTIDPQLEQEMVTGIKSGPSGSELTCDPLLVATVLDGVAVRFRAASNAPALPVLVCWSELRPVLRRLLASRVPDLAVVSYEEIEAARTAAAEIVGTVSATQEVS
jgi:flagellar biosynthesis protein FlhA